MINYRLSEDDFTQVVSTLKRFRERPQQAAWRVLVAGETLETTASALEISKEAVRKSVGRVVAAWQHLNLSELDATRKAAMGLMQEIMPRQGIPNGWEPVVVYLPRSMAKSIRELEIQQLAAVRKKDNNNPANTQMTVHP